MFLSNDVLPLIDETEFGRFFEGSLQSQECSVSVMSGDISAGISLNTDAGSEKLMGKR